MELNKRKCVKEKPKPLNFCYSFEEAIDVVTMATAVRELIKHLLFMKDQIPMPVDLLQCSYDKTLHTGKSRASILKKLKFVDNLTMILDSLTNFFSFYEVQKVVLLLGSTLVSPKETFLILSDTKGLVNNGINNNTIVRKLLRTVVTSEEVNEHIYGIHVQNIHIVVSLKEPYSLVKETNAFIPKTNFVLPRKGKTCVFKLGCKSDFNFNKEYENESMPSDFNAEKETGVTDYWYSHALPLKGFKETCR